MVDILNNRGWNLMGIAHYAIRLVLNLVQELKKAQKLPFICMRFFLAFLACQTGEMLMLGT